MLYHFIRCFHEINRPERRLPMIQRTASEVRTGDHELFIGFLGFIGICWDLLGFLGISWDLLGFIGIL